VAFENGLYKPCASNASPSVIRSADAVCVAELSQHWHGRDHAGARALLAQTSLGEQGAGSREQGAEILDTVLQSKNDYQYRTVATTQAHATELLDAAREPYAKARNAVDQAGYSTP
jgi:hypothetical protein